MRLFSPDLARPSSCRRFVILAEPIWFSLRSLSILGNLSFSPIGRQQPLLNIFLSFNDDALRILKYASLFERNEPFSVRLRILNRFIEKVSFGLRKKSKPGNNAIGQPRGFSYALLSICNNISIRFVEVEPVLHCGNKFAAQRKCRNAFVMSPKERTSAKERDGKRCDSLALTSPVTANLIRQCLYPRRATVFSAEVALHSLQINNRHYPRTVFSGIEILVYGELSLCVLCNIGESQMLHSLTLRFRSAEDAV